MESERAGDPRAGTSSPSRPAREFARTDVSRETRPPLRCGRPLADPIRVGASPGGARKIRCRRDTSHHRTTTEIPHHDRANSSTPVTSATEASPPYHHPLKRIGDSTRYDRARHCSHQQTNRRPNRQDLTLVQRRSTTGPRSERRRSCLIWGVRTPNHQVLHVIQHACSNLRILSKLATLPGAGHRPHGCPSRRIRDSAPLGRTFPTSWRRWQADLDGGSSRAPQYEHETGTSDPGRQPPALAGASSTQAVDLPTPP